MHIWMVSATISAVELFEIARVVILGSGSGKLVILVIFSTRLARLRHLGLPARTPSSDQASTAYAAYALPAFVPKPSKAIVHPAKLVLYICHAIKRPPPWLGWG